MQLKPCTWAGATEREGRHTPPRNMTVPPLERAVSPPHPLAPRHRCSCAGTLVRSQISCTLQVTRPAVDKQGIHLITQPPSVHLAWSVVGGSAACTLLLRREGNPHTRCPSHSRCGKISAHTSATSESSCTPVSLLPSMLVDSAHPAKDRCFCSLALRPPTHTSCERE